MSVHTHNNINDEYIKYKASIQIQNLKNKVENERLLKENQSLLVKQKQIEVDLSEQYRKSEEIRNDKLHKLNASLSEYRNVNNSLLKTLDSRKSTNQASDSVSSNNKETISDERYITALDQLYREALQDGAEASEAVERVKVEYQQCVGDIASYGVTIEQYNKNIIEYNKNIIEEKE